MLFLIVYIFIVNGLTGIITSGKIFEPLRRALDNGSNNLSSNFFGLLITCTECVGFWVGVCLFIFGLNLIPPVDLTYVFINNVILCLLNGGVAAFVASTTDFLLSSLDSCVTAYMAKIDHEINSLKDDK